MKNKINLIFALLYFSIIPIGLIINLFNPLFDNIYYGHLVYILNCIFKTILYISLAIILDIIYRKIDGKKVREKKEPLTLKKKIVLYCLTLFFITIISLMSNWQLKPLSDLGEKYTLIQVYEKLGDMALLIGEVYLMMFMFKHFDIFYVNNFKDKFKNFSLSIVFILFTYSIYSLITSYDIYQLIFIPFTMLLGFIYPYTNKSFYKTYLIAVLVFLF